MIPTAMKPMWRRIHSERASPGRKWADSVCGAARGVDDVEEVTKEDRVGMSGFWSLA
jgi:hypothetical protein